LEILSNTQITKAAMNKTTLLLLAFAVSLPLAAADVTTTSGRSFKNCTVLQVNPDGVTFRHSKGLARVLFSDMTPSAQKAFGYDADKEADYRKQQAEERAQKRELARQQAEAAAKAYAAAQQAAMENRTHRALQTAALVQAVASQQMGGGWGMGGFVSIGGGVNGYGPYNGYQTFDGKSYARHGHGFGRQRYAPYHIQGYSDSLFSHYGALVNHGAISGGGIIGRHVGNAPGCAPTWNANQGGGSFRAVRPAPAVRAPIIHTSSSR
jgi:hypothetical protein